MARSCSQQLEGFDSRERNRVSRSSSQVAVVGASGLSKLCAWTQKDDTMFTLHGSVFPEAFIWAFPCAIISGVFKLLMEWELLPLSGDHAPLTDQMAWTGFTALLGFLIVFRTSQAYGRFWEGATTTHSMKAEWFDACSCLVSFCRHSQANRKDVEIFENILVRLFSVLHAVALAEIEESKGSTIRDVNAFTYDLIDVQGLDHQSLKELAVTSNKVELVYQWILCLIVDGVKNGGPTPVLSIPPPILSRAFQELANGMVQYHAAHKISRIKLPFPYVQVCQTLLAIHWSFTTILVPQWVSSWYWAVPIAFIQVFILSAMNLIAKEIENPFGTDPNDLNGRSMQTGMNAQLKLLLSPGARRVPTLSSTAFLGQDVQAALDDHRVSSRGVSMGCLAEAWEGLGFLDNVSIDTCVPSARRKSVNRGDRTISMLPPSSASSPLSHRISSRGDLAPMCLPFQSGSTAEVAEEAIGSSDAAIPAIPEEPESPGGSQASARSSDPPWKMIPMSPQVQLPYINAS